MLTELHPYLQLLDKCGRGEAGEEESLLAAAIGLLAVQPRYTNLKLEQIYDSVVKHRNALQPLPANSIMERGKP